jgi:hypothetical protein
MMEGWPLPILLPLGVSPRGPFLRDSHYLMDPRGMGQAISRLPWGRVHRLHLQRSIP